MKKFLICLLSVLLICSSLLLSSCDSSDKIDDINGLSAEEAYTRAIASLDDIERYRVDLDMKGSIKILFSIPLFEAEDFYYYIYDGDNGHYGITDEGVEQLKESDVEDILNEMQEELWYYNGVCYVRDGGFKYKFESEVNPIERSDYEIAVEEVLAENSGKVQCYKDGDKYYFTVTIKDPSEAKLFEDADKEVYTVYFDEDGYISNIHVYAKTGMFEYEYDSEYSYDDVPAVTPPSDAQNYTKY